MNGFDLILSRRFNFLAPAVLSLIAVYASTATAVEFDFPRTLECRDVTPCDSGEHYPDQRVIEMSLRLSVRFHGKDVHEVERIDVDLDGTSGSLLVHEFSPTTTLASDLSEDIQRTTTTEKKHALDATLGGGIPIAVGDVIAHVTPSVSGGLASRKTDTVTTSQLPPKRTIVVSGTTQQGRGVFFKMHRSSQTTLEGVHELVITFLAPVDWQTGTVQIRCAAHGHRRLLGLVAQQVTLGSAESPLHLYLAGNDEARQVAERRAESRVERHRCSRLPLIPVLTDGEI